MPRTVIGASLFERNTRYVTRYVGRDPYDQALIAAYVAETGIVPPLPHSHPAELLDQFTYRAKNERGRRIIAAARV